MHIPRLFLTTDEVRTAGAAPGLPLDLNNEQSFDITSRAVINQISNVLRLKTGDRLVVLNNTGRIHHCHIDRLERGSITCTVDRVEEQIERAAVSVTVALSVLKGERFDWALEKLTEVGVATIVPLLTQRAVVKLPEGTTGDAKGVQNKMARWQAIVKEAAEQSERATIPHVVAPKKFENFIQSLTSADIQPLALICAERLRTNPLKHILRDHFCNPEQPDATADKTIVLIVGPEGGFSEEEIESAEKAGVVPVSLGARILRSETAAIYSVVQVLTLLEK